MVNDFTRKKIVGSKMLNVNFLRNKSEAVENKVDIAFSLKRK